MKIIDIHTHTLKKDAIVSINPYENMEEGYLYSVGIHPWYIPENIDYESLKNKCEDKRVVAIGECGLDYYRQKISKELQKEVFIQHINISEELEKPMIIHCVKAYEDLLSIYRKKRPKQAWIMHGFRQKSTIAKQLLDAGMYISLGDKFNADTALGIPSDKLLLETDDGKETIMSVAERVSAVINKDINLLIKENNANLMRII